MKCPVCNGQKHYKNVFGKDGTCQYCLGTGEVEEKKRTNFQRITASPEALAEFIVELVDDCTIRHECGICHSWCDEKVVSAWLKQESDTE